MENLMQGFLLQCCPKLVSGIDELYCELILNVSKSDVIVMAS